MGWALAIAGLVAACASGGGVSVASFPAGTIGPATTAGAAASQTRIELVRVLGEHNLVLQDSEAPFRPAEDRAFTTTPRALYQVILPDAPTEGFIVVYEFPDAATAAGAAADQAAYLATGPARVQSAFGTRHVIRLVGSTVVVYSWVPEGAADKRQPEIQAALETLGTGVPVPS
ncbi:MAG TPA: hypothetical protein VM408_01920 [Methylomirabilota bacterium]|nr:hypothetical protein [Methylomirabilota bacterium]